jgi:hypothetical protein
MEQRLTNNETIITVAGLIVFALVMIFVPDSKCKASPAKIDRTPQPLRGALITPDMTKPVLDGGPHGTAKTLELDDQVNIKVRYTIKF